MGEVITIPASLRALAAETFQEADLPANVALMRLAMAAERPEQVAFVLRELRGTARGPDDVTRRIESAQALWTSTPDAFTTVKGVIGGVAHDLAATDLAVWAETFDRLARDRPEGGVALYALGNPDLLRAATAEVVAWLDREGLLGPAVRLAEIGCGIGRLVAALAPRVAQVTGLDLSPGMITRARERCAGLPNVDLRVTGGSDLALLPTEGFELLLAADVFPYLVQTGDELAAVHVEEAARVLAPGGHLVILNYSYRGDLERDRRELAQLAGTAGLVVERAGTRDFQLWDATTYLLGRP